MEFPAKFWKEVCQILFGSADDAQALPNALQMRSPKVLHHPLFGCLLYWQVKLTDDKLLDVVANYEEGGSVRQLAKYFNKCVASGSTLSWGMGRAGADMYKPHMKLLTCFFPRLPAR